MKTSGDIYLNVGSWFTADETGGWWNKHLFGVSMATICEAQSQPPRCFTETEVPALLERLEVAGQVIR